MSVFFNGRLITSPATASAVDSSRLYNRGLSVGNVLALVGTAAGGKPKTALRFGSAAEAKAILRDGDLLRAVEMAFNPSAETGAPASIVCVRPEAATQSTLTLLDAASAGSIVLTSTNYGIHTNQIKAKVEAGTTAGLKLTTQFGNDYCTVDNLERRCLSVSYAGAEATATVAVTTTTITVTVGASANPITLSSFPTVQSLVDRLNIIPGITALVLDGNGAKATSGILDAAASSSIKSLTVVLKSDLQAAIDWINSASETYVTAARASGASLPPAPIGFTYLSGGTTPSAATQDWSDAFVALQGEDVQWVTPLTETSAVHAMADAHAVYMSSVVGKERRAICGTALGTTDVAAIAAAKAINSDRTSLAHIGIYNYDPAGALTLYAPCFAAAIVASGFCGLNPGMPMTNHSIKVAGVERSLRNPTDTDALIRGGVLCIENSTKGFRVVQSISTWLNNTNYDKVEQSVGVALDLVMRNVRNSLDELRGQKNSPSLLNLAVEKTDTVLRELARPEPSGPGVLAGDKANPAYKGITASIEGDQLRVSFQASPVLPANYVLVTCYAVPYAGTASI